MMDMIDHQQKTEILRNEKRMVRKIKLFDPVVGIQEKKAILQILNSGFWASGAGSGTVLRFENEFKKYLKLNSKRNFKF